MSGDSSKSAARGSGWDIYWQGAAEAAAFTANGRAHPATRSFWDEFFSELRKDRREPRCIDIATGNGEVVERLRLAFAAPSCEIVCLDISEAAIRNVLKRFSGTSGIAADAAATALRSATFDVVTSQFGIEYAAPGAVDEAARLVAPGGCIAFMLHYRDGLIHRQSFATLDAVRRTRESAFIPGAMRLFTSGFATVNGGDRTDYDRAIEDFKPAVHALRSILSDHGPHIAAGSIRRIHNDVAAMHRRMRNYEPAAILAWLRRMEGEFNAYEKRMLAMCQAALGEDAFQRMGAALVGKGFRIRRAEPLLSGTAPLAWVLVAGKDAAGE